MTAATNGSKAHSPVDNNVHKHQQCKMRETCKHFCWFVELRDYYWRYRLLFNENIGSEFRRVIFRWRELTNTKLKHNFHVRRT